LVGAVTAAVVVGATVPISAFAVATAQTAAAQQMTASAATLFGTAKPASAHVDSDTNSVELGTTFTASVPGEVVGVRYYKTAENTGPHVGNLWNSSGKRLATANFSSESASGWQSVLFSKPVTVAAGQRYVASYHAPKGRYSTTVGFVPPVSASKYLSTPAVSGVYSYGNTSSFPTKTWQSSGYWADVLFVPAKGASTPPAVSVPVTSTPTPTPTLTPTPTPTQTQTPTPTPTPKPTQTPTPPSSGSTSTAFGGASNTGPKAAGFNPTQAYTGPMTITTSGTVITNKVIPAGLVISADNVTLQGNLIVGSTDVSWDQAAIQVTGKNVKIVDNEIRGTSSTDWTKTPASGVKLQGDAPDFERNNVYWIGGDGVSIWGANAQIIGNWVHDFVMRDGVHYDAVTYPMNPSFTDPGLIQDNTVELWTSGGMTASLSFPDTASKIVINHNLLAGGNYTIMSGGGGITITNNLFWTKFSSNVGLYGTDAHLGIVPGVTWSNNAYTSDGVTKGATVGF
jgi:hypothetical protein